MYGKQDAGLHNKELILKHMVHGAGKQAILCSTVYYVKNLNNTLLKTEILRNINTIFLHKFLQSKSTLSSLTKHRHHNRIVIFV